VCIPNEALPVIDKVCRDKVEAAAAGGRPVFAVIEIGELTALLTRQLLATID